MTLSPKSRSWMILGLGAAALAAFAGLDFDQKSGQPTTATPTQTPQPAVLASVAGTPDNEPAEPG